jgi:hypothetical protein
MKRGSQEIGNGEGISIIASRLVRHQYRIFQNFRPIAVVAKPVDERKKLESGSEQKSADRRIKTSFLFQSSRILLSTSGPGRDSRR